MFTKVRQKGKPVGSQKNTITINGRVYDTTTGKAVSVTPKTHIITPTKTHVPVKARATSEKLKPKQIHVSNVDQTKTEPTKITVHVHRETPRVATKLHQKTERTKTLMRSSVRKPSAPKAASTVTISGLASQPSHKIVHSKVPARTTRASSVEQSAKISKFAQQNNATVTQKVETIPVKAAPRRQDADETSAYVSKQAPPISAQRHTKSTDMFESALQNATSHRPSAIGSKKSHHKRKRAGLAQVGAVLALVIILGGFFTYNNIPRITLRTAAKRTGFTASVPSYKPVGFSLSRSIQYQPGRVVLSYSSSTDNRGFSITQEKTTLQNDNLPSAFLSSRDTYQTKTDGGKSIYIYDGSNATWVDNGIWYNVQGNAGLSADQLRNVASSL